MSELIIADRSDIVAIADAVRSKTGNMVELSYEDIIEGINSIDLESTVITDVTSGAKTIEFTLDNVNTEYRYEYASGITSLTLSTSLSVGSSDITYYSIVFESGTTATVFTDNVGIYFAGNDCALGDFIPAISMTYEVGIWWSGSSWQGVVRGT